MKGKIEFFTSAIFFLFSHEWETVSVQLPQNFHVMEVTISVTQEFKILFSFVIFVRRLLNYEFC